MELIEPISGYISKLTRAFNTQVLSGTDIRFYKRSGTRYEI